MEESFLIILVSLLFSAFFSGMEIAYVSANKIHLEIEKKRSSLIAAVLKRITRRPSKFIATMLVGNNIALVIYGLYMGDVLMQWIPLDGFYELLVHTLISTLVILWTAEFLPKVFFQIYANQLVVILSIPAYIFYLLFSVISEWVIWISDFVLRVLFRNLDSRQERLENQEFDIRRFELTPPCNRNSKTSLMRLQGSDH